MTVNERLIHWDKEKEVNERVERRLSIESQESWEKESRERRASKEKEREKRAEYNATTTVLFESKDIWLI